MNRQDIIKTMTLFDEEFEAEAIERIRKFAKIAEAMEFEVAVGFSGGKDSEVVYDLCKRSCIEFKAYYNHAFESCTTMNFIREHYPDVIWRRQVKEGFFQNIWTNHNGLLPTVEYAYCCADYKHNAKQVDACSIVGVRRAESKARANRKTFEVRNKTMIKKNKALFTEYFTENCTGSGSPSIIQLKPIVDWSDEEVWNYIKKYNLPINPEYATANRVGCVICPKANIERNCNALMRYPKLIDAIIKARENANRSDMDWIVTSDKVDLTSDKVEYVLRWLNHSFRPFSKKQRKLADMVKQRYNELKQNQ
jgi:phosphoadenosine phosphosulfate reductase